MTFEKEYDLICVGGGIMSANLALMSKMLNPDLKILILERLDDVALESSSAWNNAGTGHSALCELNYCPDDDKTGKVDISKAIDICKQFEISKQFWSYLVEEGLIEYPENFVVPVPHYSWVEGKDNVDYLKNRYEEMRKHFMFNTIEYTEDKKTMEEWFPLIMENRSKNEDIAASKVGRGTEVNFGKLTKKLFQILEEKYKTPVHCGVEVMDVDPSTKSNWKIKAKVLNAKKAKKQKIRAKHVFIGAGGGSLLLLQKVEIKEKEGYGGFPVSGEWLVCRNEDIIKKHKAKVYTKSGPDDPPMSTPHLDTRYINGKRELLFGPFAGFSPKFLKKGSNLDLIKSIQTDNLKVMTSAFWRNLPLTKYLINQITKSHEDRMDDLRKFVKNAKSEDWTTIVAGQRVQIIKKDEFQGGKLQFGTEVISNTNGTITCLLGASPGASTAAYIMLKVLNKAFPELTNTEDGKSLLDKMVPMWNSELTEDLFKEQLKRSKEILKLE
jgi:malate dehydrogenase (quinone)